MADDATVIFLHVGKTAGATMRRALRKEFSSAQVLELKAPTVAPGRLRRDGAIDHFAGLPEAERARLRLIMGHMTFGLDALIPRPATYVTLLREPLKLIASQFHHVKRHEGHLLHEEAKAYPDLAAYVRSGISLEMDNSQTRAFAGDTTTPFGGCTPAMLERAKANLVEAFAVVGLTERFDESLVLMRRAFAWTRLRYVSVNIDPGRSQRARSPTQTSNSSGLRTLSISSCTRGRPTGSTRHSEAGPASTKRSPRSAGTTSATSRGGSSRRRRVVPPSGSPVAEDQVRPRSRSATTPVTNLALPTR